MNTIASLLFLQAEKMKTSEAVEALHDAQSRVNSMMVLYDKLYLAHSFREIPFKAYFTSLIEEIMVNFSDLNKIKLEMHIEDFTANTKMLSTLGIIINEVITNAMKYAFKGRDEGVIYVSATVKDKLMTLVVADNGVGIPEAIDIEKSTGFGFELIQMLTKQLNGSVRIEREGGLKYIIEFEI